MKPTFEVQIRIQKPVADVFDAVYDPQKLSGYFTNGGASAPLDEGTTVQWAFDDNPGDEKITFPVEVERSEKNKSIVLRWQGTKEELNRVEMDFEAAGEDETIVRISESGWEDTDDDIKSSYSNCMGWAQMLSSLKAYTEYGINLRRGAYTGLYKAEGSKTRSTAG